jgi:hypothetical protein
MSTNDDIILIFVLLTRSMQIISKEYNNITRWVGFLNEQI